MRRLHLQTFALSQRGIVHLASRRLGQFIQALNHLWRHQARPSFSVKCDQVRGVARSVIFGYNDSLNVLAKEIVWNTDHCRTANASALKEHFFNFRWTDP